MTQSNTNVVTHYRACHLCEAICGLEIKVRGQDIVSIKGDPNDPLSRGHICPKAVALQDIQEDPDRLRHPMRRLRDQDGGQQWQRISWDEAFDLVAERLVAIRAQHGDNALGVYLGNPSVHNYGILTHQGALFSYLRTQNRFSATSVDQLPQHLVSLWLYGHKDLLPVPDIDRTDYFLMLGANPIASNGSIWTVPDVRKRIKELQDRDGTLVVIDPRRTETAEVADQHYAIRPGSDALFLAALLNTLFSEGLTDTEKLGEITVGLDQVQEAIARFTPESVAATTGIDAAATRSIAREFAAAKSAVCYGRMGVSTNTFGTLNHWLIQLINIVTGNLDRVGGTLFTHPAVNDFAKTRPGQFARFRSRVSERPEFGGELPAAVIAEEILTPGEGQIKALFTVAGNPVLSTPNGTQLDSALASLEFMVSLDPYINETTRHADVVLPPTAPLEHDHYDIAFHTLAVRNTARFNEAVFEKPDGALHDWEIFTELGKRVAALQGIEAREQVPPAELIDNLLRAGNYSAASGHDAQLDLEKLRQNPSGVDLGPLQPALPQRLNGEAKVINCAVPACLDDLERAALSIDDEAGLLLIGRRHVRSNNSWMHNYKRLVKGRDRSQLLMHPEDMRLRDIVDGAAVRIESRVGAVQVTALASKEMIPGAVCLPHGFGHQRDGVRLSVAGTLAGASMNDLTDDADLDPISGNAVLNGVRVEVVALDGKVSSTPAHSDEETATV
jgi:anaerobic selenocysteine-containing dehydrogenase